MSASPDAHDRPTQPTDDSARLVDGPWGVRCQISDVGRAMEFYTTLLGFAVDMQYLPAFAQLSLGTLRLILSGPGSSGARPMPDGHAQEPGGWNRVVLRVRDVSVIVELLARRGVRVRNDVQTGPGGRQVQIEDPDGNPIELFEPSQR